MAAGIGADEYHERTKHSPRSVRADSHRLDFENKPRPFKLYRDRRTEPVAESIRPPMQPALSAIAEPGPEPEQAGAVDLEAVTNLLYLAAGITKRIQRGDRDLLFRAAACTGALYHIDLYLVTSDLDGLPAGVYHFDPRSCALDVIRTGDFRAALATAGGSDPRIEAAPVSMVATSTWWRNAWKYRARTYRHAFWDSGTVLANLLGTAGALDLPATVRLGFVDEVVAALLGLDIGQEAPLEIVPIGAGDPAPLAPDVPALDPETVPLSDEVVEYPLIEQGYRGSMLAEEAAVRTWRERAPDGAIRSREPAEGERISAAPVGPAAASKVPLYRTIRRRGSCREYARDDLNARKVATILDRATRGVATDVTGAGTGGLRFNDIYCLINGLEGVPAGVYQYHPQHDTLEQLRAGACRQEAGHLALDQPLGANAALNCYFMTDLAAVVDRLGDRGYRAAQLEAAVTAGRLYLGAYAHRDLGATGLTFYDDDVTEFLSPWAADRTPTFLWTLGRPA
ncbi:MAG: SagB family peptide dehydrogenase [Halobacteriales archaeon]